MMPGNQARDPSGVPSCFVRPQSDSMVQRSLFPEDLSVVLARLSVSGDELGRWHERGWLSFGPNRTAPLETWDVNEIRFVRDITRSGLSDALVERLLSALPRPMNFDPARIAYSFLYGWVMAPDEREVIDAHVDGWIEGLAEEGDVERIRDLERRIADALVAASTAAEGQAE